MFVAPTRTGVSVLLLAAVALTMACTTTERVAPTHGQAARELLPGDPSAIVSEVRVSPAEIRVGETMQIEVTVHNPTAQTIRVHFSSGCMVMFAVRDAGGETVAPIPICTANAPTLEMTPGQTITRPFRWDGTVSGASSPGLPPGEYTVVGGFDPGVRRNASAPAAIKILAPILAPSRAHGPRQKPGRPAGWRDPRGTR